MSSVVKNKRIPLIVLLAFAAACGAWLLSLDPHARFTTDVTELLPANERDPEARFALSLVHERQARVVMIVLEVPIGTPAPDRDAAVRIYLDTLLFSKTFSEAYPLAGQTWQHDLGRFIFERRFNLLLPGWIADQRQALEASRQVSGRSPHVSFPDWLATRAVAALDDHLASPESAVTTDLLPADPLLLLPSLAERAAGLSTAPTFSPTRVLVWAVTSAGPLTEAGQQPVFTALASAETAARARIPALSARFTGIARFAAAAKDSTRAEISRLNILALVAVLAITALCVRRVLGLLHLLPVVLLSTLGAIAVTTAVFPRVHILVFVLGSLLCGVAVDYAFHVILARRENESYSSRVRRLALPLLGGAGTTVAGFLALVFSGLPLVRQLGVYVAAGIVTGLGVTLVYFTLFPRLDLAPRAWNLRLSLPARLRNLVFIVLASVAVFGLSRIRWQDDLRDLEFPSPALRAEDGTIRAAFGETTTSATFLTRGKTLAQARLNWSSFVAAAPADARPVGVGLFLPEPHHYSSIHSTSSRVELAGFMSAFRAAAEKAGFDAEAFAPFYADFSAWLKTPAPDYETLARDTLAALPGPLGMLSHADDDGAWLISSAPRAFPVPPDRHLETVHLSGIEGLNHLFARYRIATGQLSLAGILALVLISCCLHGPRLGLRIAALPLLATALAFGLLALRGEPFGIFHLLGALLGVCLADDYAHFAHADDGAPQSRASIRLSGLTTAASFATLSLSSIPAVSSLGAAVTLIIFLALIFVETDLFSLRRHV